MSDSILQATEMDYGRVANHNRTEVLQGRAAARSEGMVYRTSPNVPITSALIQEGAGPVARELG